MAEPTVRIAMWSGPRNISTAMMRAFENRPDCAVIDEPFYACYLLATGVEHPGREDVLRHCETDWRRVVRTITGPVPGGAPVWYQKHMAQHMTLDIGREWMDVMHNCFLIRHPRQVIRSFSRVIETPTMRDIGLDVQLELFHRVCDRTGRVPPVLDSRDVLTDPRRALTALCDAVGIAFDERMLSWPPGPRDTDGVWAKHWYASVERSTGFAPPAPDDEPLPERLRPLLDACTPSYNTLVAHRLLRTEF